VLGLALGPQPAWPSRAEYTLWQLVCLQGHTSVPSLPPSPRLLPAGTCCSGHSHAPRINGKSDCSAGGVYEPPAREQKGARKEYRVDQHNKGGWRGGALEGTSGCLLASSAASRSFLAPSLPGRCLQQSR
jgi:hypothetical protein